MFSVDMDLLPIGPTALYERQLLDDVRQTLKKSMSIRSADSDLVTSEDQS
ncbi:MAG: hypothetical protein MK102_07395 [Fuerstiella sp.]|nr:hypothetical protein [Fuerstiella sp.]